MAIRFGRATAETWRHQVALPRKLATIGRGKQTRIMFPSTHDITPDCLDVCLSALDQMLGNGHEVLVVSKPHVDCIRAICERACRYHDNLIFRFTIGSASNTVLKSWEPYAPPYEERLQALAIAKNNGFRTSISCEPMLDANIEQVVMDVSPYVTDSIWIGTMNDVRQRLKLNGASPEIAKMGEELLKLQSRELITQLYDQYKGNSMIRWKDGIKKILGLERPTQAGLDI